MTNWHDSWHHLWFNWGSRLRAPLIDQKEIAFSIPLSAREAFERVWPEIEKFDPESKLRSIQSEGEVLADGRAHGWAFHVDAINRRAKGVFHWHLSKNGSEIVRELAPFPAIGSPIHRIVSMGQGGEKMLDAAWKKMREDASDLPIDFEDSTEVAASLWANMPDGLGRGSVFLNATREAATWEAWGRGKVVELAAH